MGWAMIQSIILTISLGDYSLRLCQMGDDLGRCTYRHPSKYAGMRIMADYVEEVTKCGGVTEYGNKGRLFVSSESLATI